MWYNKREGGEKLDIATLLQNYAFPIVCCIAMAWYVYDRGEKERQDRKEESEKHKEEVDNLSVLINNNTLAINRLIDKLGG